jgi:hypothetical protein
MREIIYSEVEPQASAKILLLALELSKKLALNKKKEKMLQAGKLIRLKRVIESTTSLLTFEETQHLLQALISTYKTKKHSKK